VLALAIIVGLFLAGVVRPPAVLEGDLADARGDRPGLRVLFVGNSLTYFNDMPQLVQRLAAAAPAGGPIFTVEYARAGQTLEGHDGDGRLRALLREARWDDVVLQEQSYRGSAPAEARMRDTDPYAASLGRAIRRAGARPLLFATWGFQEGDPDDVPGDDYAAMQQRVLENYAMLGAELRAPVVPVGAAWERALSLRPTIGLWAWDGGHPSPRGSYLAACVFYGALTGRNPERSAFTAGLPPSDAHFLQRVAADVTGVASRG
jgi:hypothetical protein